MAQRVASQNPPVRWWCPQLPPSPREAMGMLMQGIAHWPQESMAVMGSSLGGFYATAVAQQVGCPAVLFNPAVDPARDLGQYIGQHTQWHAPEEHFYFKPEYVQELRELRCGELNHSERTLVIIAKGDEVLDWREMLARYAGAHIKLLEGGDHALSDFESHLPTILEFLALR